MEYFVFSEMSQLNFASSKIIAARLREERLRLSPRQGDFATVLGVRQSQLSEWENGGTHLKGEQLALLASSGIDVQYLLTGQRAGSLLTVAETALLDSFRSMDGEAQAALRTLVERLSGSHIEKPSIHSTRASFRPEKSE